MDKKEYDAGYQAAIDALRKVMKGDESDLSSNNSGNSNNGLNMPGEVYDKAKQEGQGASGNQSSSGSEDKQVNPSGSKSGGSGSNGSGSRDASGGKNQGVVRPEDCIGPDSLNGVPGEAGGMISTEEGEQICRGEGYEPEGGSDSTVEREWKDAALKSIQKLKGDEAGNYKNKIEGLYKTSSDWKKELRKVVGHSISPEDKRQAYANKNILVAQDRIARTDKDKYDNLDYMMAWIDSSGSMSNDQLKICLSEVYQVALAKKPIKLVVIQCDTRIQEIKEYTDLRKLKQDMIHATVKGRGGTELKPCWDLLINDPKYKRRPCELVMVFTDGYLDQYKRNPKTMKNLCWVILDNPSWNIQYKDINTKVVYINTADIK